jgi:hypothetical protein
VTYSVHRSPQPLPPLQEIGYQPLALTLDWNSQSHQGFGRNILSRTSSDVVIRIVSVELKHFIASPKPQHDPKKGSPDPDPAPLSIFQSYYNISNNPPALFIHLFNT